MLRLAINKINDIRKQDLSEDLMKTIAAEVFTTTVLDPLFVKAYGLFQKLKAAGIRSYLVGGCVRDTLSGGFPKDYDFVVTHTPTELKEALGTELVAAGNVFGTFIIDGMDVACARRDGIYTDGRHPEDVVFTRSIEEDSRRRDFTINAIYLDLDNGEIHDFHRGQQDLSRRVIRCIGDDHERIAEDKLRMLRAIRFCCQLPHFSIESNLLGAIRAHAKEIKELPQERITPELLKCLTPTGVDLMFRFGLLRYLCPPLTKAEASYDSDLKRTKAMLCYVNDFTRTHRSGPIALAALTNFCLSREDVVDWVKTLKLSAEDQNKAIQLIESRDGHLRNRLVSGGRVSIIKFFRDPRMTEKIVLDDSERKVMGELDTRNLDPDSLQSLMTGYFLRYTDIIINPCPVTGQALVDLGVAQGPVIGQIMRAADEEYIKGDLDSSNWKEFVILNFGEHVNGGARNLSEDREDLLH